MPDVDGAVGDLEVGSENEEAGGMLLRALARRSKSFTRMRVMSDFRSSERFSFERAVAASSSSEGSSTTVSFGFHCHSWVRGLVMRVLIRCRSLISYLQLLRRRLL